MSGQSVESGERAETFADYYEKVQWSSADRAENSRQGHGLTSQPSPIAVEVSNFTLEELRAVLKKLGRGKACGPDGIPAELWIALYDDAEALHILLHVCNTAWISKSIPESWKSATVITLFKSGSTALPKNYRPISLLSVGYKILARLLLNRLRSGGVEERLRPSQFGFRAGRNTSEAFFIAKRFVDQAIARKRRPDVFYPVGLVKGL